MPKTGTPIQDSEILTQNPITTTVIPPRPFSPTTVIPPPPRPRYVPYQNNGNLPPRGAEDPNTQPAPAPEPEPSPNGNQQLTTTNIFTKALAWAKENPFKAVLVSGVVVVAIALLFSKRARVFFGF